MGTYITWPSVKGTIGIVGGLFLFWMAYGILKDSIHSAALELSGEVTKKVSVPGWRGLLLLRQTLIGLYGGQPQELAL
ncbi:hypothetical protein [Desulfosporosinus sp. SB140]|uniref:hypothetical protein n=1 Tax=Desulfosporosinus paludis TaxID=3115649 RepID=UPI003890E5B1